MIPPSPCTNWRRADREALPLLHDYLANTTSKERQTRLRRAIDSIRQMPVPSQDLREIRVTAAREEFKRLATGNPEAGLTRAAESALKKK